MAADRCSKALEYARHNSLAVDDSIRIKHGDNLENETFPQEISYGITAHKELQGPLHDPAGIGLTGVNTGH